MTEEEKMAFLKMERERKEIIERYRNVVPEELIDIWREHGFGSILNGYLRVIDPGDYITLVKETYFRGDVSIPIMVTAFGDIVTYEENSYIGIIKYKNMDFSIMIKGFHRFMQCLNAPDILREYFDIDKYEEATRLLEKPEIDECYGYTPLLALGGVDNVQNLRIVKTREHIHLISQAVGIIGS